MKANLFVLYAQRMSAERAHRIATRVYYTEGEWEPATETLKIKVVQNHVGSQ